MQRSRNKFRLRLVQLSQANLNNALLEHEIRLGTAAVIQVQVQSVAPGCHGLSVMQV
jgi:hypothetical protein